MLQSQPGVSTVESQHSQPVKGSILVRERLRNATTEHTNNLTNNIDNHLSMTQSSTGGQDRSLAQFVGTNAAGSRMISNRPTSSQSSSSSKVTVSRRSQPQISSLPSLHHLQHHRPSSACSSSSSSNKAKPTILCTALDYTLPISSTAAVLPWSFITNFDPTLAGPGTQAILPMTGDNHQ